MKQTNFHRPTESTRRHFFKAMAAGGLFFTQRGAYAQALVLTPAQTEGPYYPNNLPLDQDNDLLILNDNITPATGTVAWISGRILDKNGQPVRNALIEIWQADNVGSYIHSQGALNGQRDGNFQGYGRFLTASDGAYLFRSIKPGLYPGRVRHVHAKVTLPGGQTLTSQLFVEGETANDSVLSGISDAAQRASVIRPWKVITGSPIGALATNWDVIMNYTLPEVVAPARPTLVSMAGVTHGATFRAGAPSGGWVTLYGAGLSTTTRTWRDSDIVNGKLPETLDGVSVSVNNRPASVYYVSPTQINVLAPEALADGSVAVTVTRNGSTSDAVNVDFRKLSPGFFQFPDENIAAVRSDGKLIGPAGILTGATTIAAKPNDIILIYATGLGPTNPAHVPGQVVTSPLATSNPVTVRIHNRDAVVSFAGLVSPGLYQLNVTVPDLPDGDYPVTASVGGVRTSKMVKLRIERAASTSNFISDEEAVIDPLQVIRHAMLA